MTLGQFRKLGVVLVLVLVGLARADGPRKTENVMLVISDGLRWQEVFNGPEEVLMNKENGKVGDVDALKKEYWRDTPEERRAALMPFVWNTMAKHGQVFGNQAKGSDAHVTNGFNFSYPGYSETLCGFPDPRIDRNDKGPNPNVSMLEWLNKKPAFKGRVAALGAWATLADILNRQRSGLFINAGFEPMTDGEIGPRMELLNRLKRETPTRWKGETFDSFTFHTTVEYLRQHKPRVLFVLLGETDEWAHEGRYADYLDAARRADDYVRELWELVQSLPEYRDKTALIFMPDHGRGDAPTEWKNHGRDTAGSQNIWIAAMGPDTPALGERTNVEAVTQSQVAATMAALLGGDYCADVPQAGRPISEIVGAPRK